jgi:hypothetical protein
VSGKHSRKLDSLPLVAPGNPALASAASTDALSAPFHIETIRRRHIWPLFICAIVVFIVVAGGLTVFNRTFMARQAAERTAIQQLGEECLDESIALIQEADSVVIELDKASESQIAEEDVPRLEALLDQIDGTKDSLDAAIEKGGQAEETFFEEEDRELARHAQNAAEHRKQMLDMSSQLIKYDIAALRAALSLEYAWALIISADGNMRFAVEVVSGTGADAVAQSRDYNQEALDKFELAQEALATIDTGFPDADLTIFKEYLNAKMTSVQLALESDEAFLAGDYETASIKNEEFVIKDAEAVEHAASIPSDLLDPIVSVYEELTKQLRDNYKAVRSQAADADAFLRAYLGVDTQQGK